LPLIIKEINLTDYFWRISNRLCLSLSDGANTLTRLTILSSAPIVWLPGCLLDGGIPELCAVFQYFGRQLYKPANRRIYPGNSGLPYIYGI